MKDQDYIEVLSAMNALQFEKNSESVSLDDLWKLIPGQDLPLRLFALEQLGVIEGSARFAQHTDRYYRVSGNLFNWKPRFPENFKITETTYTALKDWMGLKWKRFPTNG